MQYASGAGAGRKSLVTLLVLVLCLTIGLSLQVTRAASASAADTSPYLYLRAVMVDASGHVVKSNIVRRSTNPAGFPQGDVAQNVKDLGVESILFSVNNEQIKAKYQTAYWLSTPFTSPATLTDEVFNGKRLPLKSLTKRDDGSTVVTPTAEVATEKQDAVELRANTNEVYNHAVLVYLDPRSAKDVHFTFSGPLTDKSVSAFATDSYDVNTDNARFDFIETNAAGVKIYETTAYVKVPRGKQVRFTATSADGTAQTVTPTLISDDSTTTSTVQTFKLRINELVDIINVDAWDITSRRVTMIAKMEAEQQLNYDQPQFNIDYVDNGTTQSVFPKCAEEGHYFNGDAYNDSQRYQNCVPNFWVGTKAIDYMENGKNYDGSSGEAGRLPKKWGFQHDNACENADSVDCGYEIAPNTDTGKGTKKSESGYVVKATNQIAYTVNAVPRLKDQGWDPTGFHYYQDFLSSITLTNEDQVTTNQSNAQTILVPFPDLCRNPAGSTGTNAEYCFVGASWWGVGGGTWSGYGQYKNRYSCIRAWMLGYARDKYSAEELNKGCDESYAEGDNAPSYDTSNPYVLLDYTIQQGANAGTRIVVKLINIRGGMDSGTSITDNTKISDNRGAFPSSMNNTRWRTRYQIEVSNPINPNMTVTANWGWSAQQRVLLGASSGIEPIQGSNDAVKTTAVSVYGVGNSSVAGVDGQETWKSICVDGENRGLDGSANGGSGCRYVWQDQGTRSDMPVGVHVKNGFKTPEHLLYAPKRYASGDAGFGQFVRYPFTKTNPITNQNDGNLYVTVPKVASTTITGSMDGENRTIHMESRVPLYVNAPIATIPLRYYDDAGNHLASTTVNGEQPFADTTIDVVNNRFRSVASEAPALTTFDSQGRPQVFLNWVLKAYKNGQELGTVGNKAADGTIKDYKVVNPSDLLHLANPVFTTATSSAVSVGGPVITDGTGTAVADELRLIAVPMTATSDTSGVTRKYDYYPVRHVVRAGQTDHVVVSHDYTAVPGLSAFITDAHKHEHQTEIYNGVEYPYVENVSTTSIGDPTTAWNADSNPGLVTPTASILKMFYTKQTTPFTFGKTVNKTLFTKLSQTTGAMPGYDFASNQKESTDFRLVLTPGTGDPIYVNAYDSLTTSTLPTSEPYQAQLSPGEYKLSEQVKKADGTWGAASPWYPQRGFTCTGATLNEDSTVLTVPETLPSGVTSVDCRVTNTTAALAVLTYDASSNSYVTTAAYKAGVPAGETYATNVDALANAATVPGALNWVAPGIAYSVAPTTVPAGYTLLGYQKFTLTDQDQQLSAHTSSGNWGAVDTTTPQAASAFVAGLLSDPSNGTGVTSDTVDTAAAQSVTTAANSITVLRAVIFPTNQLSTLTFKATTDTTDYNPDGSKGDASDNTKYALQLRWSGGTGAIKHNNTNLSDGNPVAADGTVSASHFYLRASATYAYKERYQGGSTTSTVTGFAELSDNYHLNNAWAPVSMSCEPSATVEHTAGTLVGSDGTVNLPAGSVTCTMVNKAAQLGVLIWDGTNNTWLDSVPAGSQQFSVDVNPTETEFIDPGKGWIAKGDRVSNSTTQISPGGTYSVVKGSMPLFRSVEKCQLLADPKGNPMSYTTGTNLSTANWVDTDCTKVTAKAGEYRVVRAVTTSTPYLPELPLTGGTARDIFLITGLLAAAVAGVSAFVIRRRRRSQA